MILPRMAAILYDKMKNYDWQGKIYTMDGADILLVRDENAACAYAWDSASRVEEIELEAVIPPDPPLDEIPSTEEVRRLRTILADLRQDKIAKIDFDRDAQDLPQETFSP